MPYPAGQTPLRALAGRKRRAADRHVDRAEEYRREAAELEAEAERRSRLAEQVRAQRIEQGLSAELTDVQVDTIGAVWASRPRTNPNK